MCCCKSLQNSCECCCCGGFKRRYMTRKERLVHLEDYHKDLVDELKAVEELIKELKKGGK